MAYATLVKSVDAIRGGYGMLRYHFRDSLRILSAVPASGVVALLIAFRKSKSRDGMRSEVIVRGLPRPIKLRNGTSDFEVFRQVFLEQQYGNLPVNNPKWIVDAGANIGLASLYFLREFPNAKIISLEPDAENFAAAMENVDGYEDRCRLIKAALWSIEQNLVVVKGDGHWASRVDADCSRGDDAVAALRFETITEMCDSECVDVFKCDIEGAEKEVFAADGAEIVRSTKCIAIELHGDSCRATFEQAISHREHRRRRQGELDVVDFS